MGKLFTARLSNGSEQFAAGMSMGRAKLFVDMTRLLETKYIGLLSGIEDDHGNDEHYIDAVQFVAFFERVWSKNWLVNENGFAHNWARYAAGMIENIELEHRQWICADGIALKPIRYMRPDDFAT